MFFLIIVLVPYSCVPCAIKLAGLPSKIQIKPSSLVTIEGILESDDRCDENPEDEILCELRKKQQELRMLSQHNLLMTKRLYKMAKEEMTRQDLRRKMAAADADVRMQKPVARVL